MKSYALTLILLCALRSEAQHQADKWYFGFVGDGLDFTQQGGSKPGCEPVVLSDGAIQGFEGVSSIADWATGELLFYTNSDSIWDRSHTPMPNGRIRPNGVPSQNTITQVLIIPLPGSDSLFYIFTNQIEGAHNGFGMRLAAVDMSLNAGMGDVIFKNVVVYADTVSEKVTAVRHANGQDIWVIGHRHRGDEFFALLVTTSGITGSAVISEIGKVYQWPVLDGTGEMKASPDGSMLAVATYEQPDIELFHFDNATGVISDPITIVAPSGNPGINSLWYGLSFSPDNSKLYAGRKNNASWPSIIQVDVSTYDPAMINASKDTITTLSNVCSLQLAPNGKIYTRRSGNHLGAINNPNADGLACDFDPEAIDFGHPPGGFNGVWGLNNYIALENYPCVEGTAIAERPEGWSAFTIQPGSAPGMFTLTAAAGVTGTLHLEIADMRGAIVHRTSVSAQNGSAMVDLRHVHAGIYVVSMFAIGRNIGTGRVVLTD